MPQDKVNTVARFILNLVGRFGAEWVDSLNIMSDRFMRAKHLFARAKELIGDVPAIVNLDVTGLDIMMTKLADKITETRTAYDAAVGAMDAAFTEATTGTDNAGHTGATPVADTTTNGDAAATAADNTLT